MRDATHSAARRIVVAWRAPRAAHDTTLPHRVLPRVQAVAALMNQLCVRFPVVAAHNGTSSFAVACPETRHPDARAAAAAVQTPVHVYNMSTGAKMFALVLSRAAPGTGTGNGDINPLAPIAQVRRPPPPPHSNPHTALRCHLTLRCRTRHSLVLRRRLAHRRQSPARERTRHAM